MTLILFFWFQKLAGTSAQRRDSASLASSNVEPHFSLSQLNAGATEVQEPFVWNHVQTFRVIPGGRSHVSWAWTTRVQLQGMMGNSYRSESVVFLVEGGARDHITDAGQVSATSPWLPCGTRRRGVCDRKQPELKLKN